jgi:ZIP family zinc transporter
MLIEAVLVSLNLIEVVTISTLAGLATGIGGFVAIIRKPDKKMLGFLMGVAAGVMVTLAFLGLMNEAEDIAGFPVAAAGFVAGSLSMLVLDFALPHKFFAVNEKGIIDGKTFKAGILIAIGISLHNFPEGFAVASGFSYQPHLGLIVAVAMALHNVPEGIAISLPVYMSGASRLSAFKMALFSGLVEPVGALAASVLLGFSSSLVPYGLSFAGGVMVFITLDELVPVAHEHGHEHFTAFGVIAGCIVTFVLLGLLS